MNNPQNIQGDEELWPQANYINYQNFPAGIRLCPRLSQKNNSPWMNLKHHHTYIIGANALLEKFDKA
jgi:hypothetical protein